MLITHNYKEYLLFLDDKLSGFFERQKDYVKCEKGCARCCKHAQFPFSLIEFTYLQSGFLSLNEQLQNIINEQILKVIAQKKEFKGETFLYDCPFLINNECSVYEYRGIVCRTFGLAQNDKTRDNITKVPFCFQFGLNYSSVIDFNTKTISQEKYEQSGFKIPPLGFNLSHDLLTDKVFEKKYNFNFGDKKPLIDWIIYLSTKTERNTI